MKRIPLFLSTVAVLFFASCREKTTILTAPEQVNAWVLNTMRDDYLWSATLPEASATQLSLTPKDYFEQYIRYRNNSGNLSSDFYGDRFSKLVPKSPTGDGDETGYYPAEMAGEDKAYGFGFESRAFMDLSGRVLFGQVLYVLPGSPAEKAGIKRGYHFNRVNNEEFPLAKETYYAALDGGSAKLQFYYPRDTTVTVQRAEYSDNPLCFDTIFETEPKTGYLVYNHFTQGDNQRYNNALKTVFSGFRSVGVETLILDLRYNGGGELLAARQLASMIARTDMLGQVMVYKEDNKSFGHPEKFRSDNFHSARDMGTANANIQRIFFITSRNSASASELLIHALRPYYGTNMSVVGEKTTGKNLGGVTITNKRYLWEIHSITMRIYDRDKVSGYELGITPEYDNIVEYTGFESLLGQFGDVENDPLLRKAMSLIDPDVLPPQAALKTKSASLQTETTVRDRGLVTGRYVVE